MSPASGSKKTASTKKLPPKKKAARSQPKRNAAISVIDQYFADLYRADSDLRGNAKNCYMVTHPNCSEKSAETLGPRLLRKVQVQAYLERKAAEVAEQANLRAVEVLEDLRELKRMCMAKEDVETKIWEFDKDEEKWNEVIVSSRHFNPNAAARALELLGKNLDLWNEGDSGHTLPGVVLIPSTMTPEEWVEHHSPASPPGAA